jgi:hypothetical protein
VCIDRISRDITIDREEKFSWSLFLKVQ